MVRDTAQYQDAVPTWGGIACFLLQLEAWVRPRVIPAVARAKGFQGTGRIFNGVV
jgi:hypothetical protein